MNDKELLEKFKMNVAINNFKTEIKKEHTLTKENKWRCDVKNIFKIGVTACLMVISVTGIVFAKDIGNFIKYYFGNNKLINEAAENGYVEEVNMNTIEKDTTLTNKETGKIIDGVNVNVKIDEFLMDDNNLSTNFTFEFDNKLKENFDLEKLQYIFFNNLTVLDEEKRVLYTSSEDAFEKIREEYDLDYTFEDVCMNGNSLSSSALLQNNYEENLVKYNFNFQANGGYFPSSKELNYIFSQIRLEYYDNSEEAISNFYEKGEYLKLNSVVLTGDWNINVKVPEKMYNREHTEYKVVNVSNPDFKVSYAGVSETGFKLITRIENVDRVDEIEVSAEDELLEELFQQKERGEISEEEYNAKYKEITDTEEYKKKSNKRARESEIITTNFVLFDEDEEKSIEMITHITNSKGDKFECPESSTFRIFENKKDWEFEGDFEMSKKDATDKLTVTMIYFGEPVYIELEKIK